MKTRRKRLKGLVMAALAAVTASVVLIGRGNSHQPAIKTAKQPSVTSTSSLPAGRKSDQPGYAVLEKRVAAFLVAYYRVLPGDTAAVRRRRISLYVSPALAARLRLGGNKPTGPSVQARVIKDELVMVVNRRNKVTMQVPVRVFVRQSNSTEKYITIETDSVWSKQSGGWFVTSFN